MKKLFRRLVREHKDASAIGIIGCADGPTTIFVGAGKSDRYWWRRTLAHCRRVAVPRAARATGDELVRHLMEEYGAFEVEPEEHMRGTLKTNVLMNGRCEAWPPPLPTPADQDGMQEWSEKYEAVLREIETLDDKALGLSYAFLALPRTEKTERFHAAAARERRREIRRIGRQYTQYLSQQPKDIMIGIERSTGHVEMYHNSCRALFDEIVLWRGVTRADIDNETPAFLEYAAAMRHAGRRYDRM